MVTGVVTVKSGTWTRGFGATGGLFSGLAGDPTAIPAVEGQVAASASNVRFDVQLRAPSSLRIENDQARIVASADLTLRGTLDRPLLFGRAEIDRGEVEFEGRRYVISRGSLDFADANRIQPFFDIEAETRVRVPQQTYLVTMRLAGTTERMQPQFTSDPPLQTLDILTLLFSDQGRLARILASDARPIQVVIAGKSGWKQNDVLQSLKKSVFGERLKLVGYVSDADLCALYSSCRAFVYPSIYEGFSLPLVEALACEA